MPSTPSTTVDSSRRHFKAQVRDLLFQARRSHERITAEMAATSDPDTLRLLGSLLGHARQMVNHLEAELHGDKAPAPAGNTLSLLVGGAR